MDGTKLSWMALAASAVMQAAYAEQPAPAPTAIPGHAPKSAASPLNAAMAHPLALYDKSLIAPAASSSPQPNAALKPSPLAPDSSEGLHWLGPEGGSPGLEYKLKENGSLRLRGNHGGAKLLVQWKF